MQFSTVQRERLISPLNLVLMAGLFAISFIFLKPTSGPGARQGLEPNLAAVAEVDELEVAYLKAHSFVGDVDSGSVMKVVRSLLQDGRNEQVMQLLSDNPDIQISDQFRFEIDMELSAAESNDSLFASLKKLNAMPVWRTEALMERAVELSQRLDHPLLSYSLYSAWASISEIAAGTSQDIQVSNIYRQCGDYFHSLDKSHQAMTCYWNAMDALPERYSSFDIQIGMLRSTVTGSEEQIAIIQNLMNDQTPDVAELTELASVLLAVERADFASPVYADLAEKDPDNAAHWYSEAARWAEASGKPGHAAVYLEAMTAFQTLDDRDLTKTRIEGLLIGAGKADDAIVRISERINQNSKNTELLERGVTIALQAGMPRKAFTWNSMLLNLEPENIGAQTQQSELALAINDLPLALRSYRDRLKQNPSDIQVRIKLAEITEWSGQPHEALKIWQSVINQSGLGNSLGDVHALRQVVRLAAMTIQPREGAEALLKLSMIEQPSDADVLQLVQFYKLNGEPKVASVALKQIQSVHGINDFILRTLAMHEYEHSEFQNSLDTWNRYVDAYGHTSDATLARMELLWRLDKKDKAAQAAQQLKGQTLLLLASDYQLRLMAEISWQYRYDWLAAVVQPRLESIVANDQRTLYSARSLASLQNAGKNVQAIEEALKLWGSTGESEFAIVAMRLALKTGHTEVLEKFSPNTAEAKTLKAEPEYWAQIAAQRLRVNDNEAAFQAYEQALKINELHVESVAGLLWLAIAEHREAQLQDYLKRYESLAIVTPELWQPMAVGYLQLGAASTSVLWFYRLIDQIDSDYSMLLTYADALEYAGRVSAARKVRQYALQHLRPILLENASADQELLLRHYLRISTRYESVGNNERLINYLLVDETQPIHKLTDAGITDGEELWRQDMAISWLMSTQQHELARVVMTQMHARRLQAPAWQTLALALKEKDNEAIEAVMQAKGSLSIGNHILALRQLGRDREAYSLAEEALTPGAWLFGSDASDRRVAQEQYVMLRNARPSFIGGTVSGRSVSGLAIRDTGVTFRHTFAQHNLGFSFSLKNRQLESDEYQLSGNEDIADLSVSLFYGNGIQGASLTAGAINTENGDGSYARGKLSMRSQDRRRGITAEFAVNESVELSSELIIAGVQNRATLAFDSDIGRHQFMRLRAELTEVNTRFDQEKVATGVEGGAEVGVHGSFGSNQWTASVKAAQVTRDRVEVLPDSLRLRADSSLDSVISEELQTFAVGATLSRGGVGMGYPQVSSPRYYLSTNVGKTWPEGTLGLQLDAGAGIRVLGGDELSFSLAHGALQSPRIANDTTKLGLNYQFHFQ
ncbi:MAG: tetratricopeptide (TPR) repeat protein [Pseudomonadales bacterium]|jgi:tetratricopeptide (TPR) repeat protein